MVILSCRDIKKSFGEVDVLKGIDLDIKIGARTGLVGNNGAGKTTLVNILFGTLKPDGGNVIKFRESLKIGYLLQNSSFIANIRAASENIHQDYLKNTSNLGLQKVDAWDSGRQKGISGGERAKIALANIMAFQPELLILDEPTNHLDFQGVTWLVETLNKYDGAVLAISHDRYFLDCFTTETIEIGEGMTTLYCGNYSFYRDEKERRRKSQLQQYYMQQKQEAKINAEIQRIKNWSAKAHREAGKKGKMAEVRMGVKEFYRAKAKKMDKRIKSRIKHLERMKEEGVEKPKEEAKVEFLLNDASKHGRRLMEAKGISKGYGGMLLFAESEFFVKRGERIGLFGPNGCGKTTLVKILLGMEKPDHGQVWVSPSAKLAYLSQEQDSIDMEKTPLDFFDIQSYQKSTAYALLANLGFDAAMLQKEIKKLSLGEITRLRIAGLILAENNLLILDEPTNHLDLHSREQLENTLVDYKGTLIIISHDRYLLEKVCDRLLLFENGQILKFEGGFREYQDGLKGRVSCFAESFEDTAAEKMIIDNKIASLLGKLSSLKPGVPGYIAADKEFKTLLMRKQELSRRM